MKNSYSKGAGTTAGTIMLIVIFAIFFSIYLYMTNAQVQSTIQLNLESLSLMKLKSTFSLFNASLGNTWFISTVQAIFMTGDESIGCGIDDTIAISEGYWYQRNPYADRDNATKIDGTPIERIPNTAKYNEIGRNPRICYPRDNHVLDYLELKLRCEDLLNLKTTMNSGGVDISFNSVGTVCGGHHSVATALLTLNNDNIESKFSQDVTVKYQNQPGQIDAQTENYNKVMTSLKLMVDTARGAVGFLLLMGDAYVLRSPATQYQQWTTNKGAYESGVKSAVETILKGGVPLNVLATTVVEVDLRAADVTVNGVMQKGTGLVVHYNANATYTEGVTQTSNSVFSWPTNSRKINSCYGYRKLNSVPGFHMGIDIVPESDEAVNTVDGGVIVDTYNECPDSGYYGSLCGKVGSEKYGNMVLIKHSNYYSFYAHLKKDSIIVAKDDVVARGQQIALMGTSGSSTGVHLHFELRTLATAGSAVNPCTLMDCQLSSDKKCDTISTPTQPTPGVYYYNDDDMNTFVKRPIRLEYSVEDYLPALDCAELPQPIKSFNWLSSNDMLCCAGNLFSCNADIPGLDSTQELTTGTEIHETTPPTAQNYCYGILSGSSLSCTANGFVLS